MPRQKLADEAGSIYHALNRGNARQAIFHKDEDYEALLHVLGEGPLYPSRFKSFPVADDDHFLVVCRYVERNPLRANRVQRAEDWRYGSLWRWTQTVEPLLPSESDLLRFRQAKAAQTPRIDTFV